MKTWVLGKVNRMNRRDARVEPHATRGDASVDDGAREPSVRALYEGRDGRARDVEHLGPYAPLIAAIRDELEQFAATQLRLHLAIAERDRYLLTSIDVECDGDGEHRELLRRFGQEFRPEQIKQYLAKEVIAGLRNASAIDLTQFGGLNAASPDDDGDDDAYGELLDALHDVPDAPQRPYKVTLAGRWSERDALGEPLQRAARAKSSRVELPATPPAGRALEVDVEDADGARRVSLGGILPNRRYVVGKGDGCDIAVNGVYASRRHCEIWLEHGAWHVADCGSTNGIRVESARGVAARCDPEATHRPASIEVAPGASIVLSAHARGEPRLYPRITLRATEGARMATATTASASVTPIAPPQGRDRALAIAATTGSATRSIEVATSALPFGVGRSRNQALVVDWSHEDVSGHHFDIVALDDDGATVVVHGDNGVSVGGRTHGPGSRFRWQVGETLVLGRRGGGDACTLTLARAS